MTNWTSLLKISPESWMIATGVAIVSYIVLRAVLSFSASRAAALAQKSDTRISKVTAEVLLYPNHFILFLVSVLFGLSVIELPVKWESWLDHGWGIAIGIQVALWLNRGINLWLREYLSRVEDSELRNRASTTTLAFLLRFVLWLTTGLAILANLGVNITALVASLGIGGIAVALALQTILSDLFASLAITLDKPFEIGDSIVFGNISGTVTRVGVKTTRIQSASGERVIISNTELLKQTVHNYRHMPQRRAVFSFSVTYETPIEQVAALPQVVQDIICAIDDTRFERAHFKTLGQSTLEFEVVYYVLVADFNRYMDIQQRINLELMQACAARKVEFRYPVRAIHVAPDSISAAASAVTPIANATPTPQTSVPPK